MLFRLLTDTRMAPGILIAALASIYIALPFAVDALFLPSPYFIQLAQLTTLACLSIILGYLLPLFDRRFDTGVLRLRIEANSFHSVVWGAFVMFLVITLATADAVPLISALKGAAASDLAQQRGDFLKTRSGAEAALIYLSTLFVSALLPYSLALQFIEKSRFRFVLLGLFLALLDQLSAKGLVSQRALSAALPGGTGPEGQRDARDRHHRQLCCVAVRHHATRLRRCRWPRLRRQLARQR